MSLVKLISPTGEVRSFNSDHAARLLALQRERKLPPSKCWKMKEDKKKDKEDNE